MPRFHSQKRINLSQLYYTRRSRRQVIIKEPGALVRSESTSEVAIRLDPARRIEFPRYKDETDPEPKPSATSRHIGIQTTGQAVLAHSGAHESESEVCFQPDAGTDSDSDDPHNLRDNPYGLGLLGPHPTTTGLLYPFDEYTQTWDRGMAEDGETRDECLRRLGLAD